MAPNSCMQALPNSVAVVVTTYNDASFLRAALDSIVSQTRTPEEIIVVDDGSRRSPLRRLKRYPEARLIRQSNKGLSAARNTGLHAAQSEFIIFLDADDRLTPKAVSAGLSVFATNPNAALVYGAHRRVDAKLKALGPDRIAAVGTNAFRDLLTGNIIAMHGAVMYRRNALCKIGGFDTDLRSCEDYDVYLRLARCHPIIWHAETVAEYRWHGRNMSRHSKSMLQIALQVHDRYNNLTGADREAWLVGRQNWIDYYQGEEASAAEMIKPSRIRRMWDCLITVTGARKA
jgi:glycosyltransferase involved in cell wall biosynthesis